MGNIGDPVSQPIPAVGTSGTTYATQINAFLTEMKTRLEALVPRASLASGDLDLNGEDLQNAGYLGLTNLLALPTAPNYSIQVYGGELYYVNASGAAKITDSGALNSAGIGAITGDYGSPNPAQFRFVDADQEYYAYDNFSAGEWAYLWAKGVDLAKNNTSTTRIRVIAPSTLAASYTLTLPDKPASSKVLYMDSSGTVGTLTSQNIELLVNPAAWEKYNMNTTPVGYPTGPYVIIDSTAISGAYAPIAHIPLPLEVGDTIQSVSIQMIKESNASTTWSLKVWKTSSTATAPTWASPTQIGSTNSSSSAGSSGAGVNVTLAVSGLSEVAATGYTYYAELISNNASPSPSSEVIGGAKVVITRAINPS